MDDPRRGITGKAAMIDKKPPAYWLGNRGLAMFVSFAVICAGLTWCAWVGGPGGAEDGTFRLARGKGDSSPTTRELYWVAWGVLGLCCAGIGGVVGTLVYSALVPPGSHSRRSFGKATLILLVATFVCVIVGLAVARGGLRWRYPSGQATSGVGSHGTRVAERGNQGE